MRSDDTAGQTAYSFLQTQSRIDLLSIALLSSPRLFLPLLLFIHHLFLNRLRKHQQHPVCVARLGLGSGRSGGGGGGGGSIGVGVAGAALTSRARGRGGATGLLDRDGRASNSRGLGNGLSGGILGAESEEGKRVVRLEVNVSHGAE